LKTKAGRREARLISEMKNAGKPKKKRKKRVKPKRRRPTAKMLLASSGRNNFEDLTISPSMLLNAAPHDLSLCTNRASMCAMLMLEKKLRNSSSVQRILGDHESDGEEIYLGLQYDIALKFNFVNPKLGVAAIRAAATLFPNDIELLHIANYRKYNSSAPCALSVGDQYPDIQLYSLNQFEKENNDAKDGNQKNKTIPSPPSSSFSTLLPISKHHQRLLKMSNTSISRNNNS
jgi:hypothetical protein